MDKPNLIYVVSTGVADDVFRDDFGPAYDDKLKAACIANRGHHELEESLARLIHRTAAEVWWVRLWDDLLSLVFFFLLPVVALGLAVALMVVFTNGSEFQWVHFSLIAASVAVLVTGGLLTSGLEWAAARRANVERRLVSLTLDSIDHGTIDAWIASWIPLSIGWRLAQYGANAQQIARWASAVLFLALAVSLGFKVVALVALILYIPITLLYGLGLAAARLGGRVERIQQRMTHATNQRNMAALAHKVDLGLAPTQEYVLYLRPLASAGRLPPLPQAMEDAGPAVRTFEHLLVWALQPEVVVLGIGGDPPPGAPASVERTDDTWFATFERLARGATATIVLPSASPSCIREVQWLQEQVSRWWVVMPPPCLVRDQWGSMEISRTWIDPWESARAAWSRLGIDLPPYDLGGGIGEVENSRVVFQSLGEGFAPDACDALRHSLGLPAVHRPPSFARRVASTVPTIHKSAIVWWVYGQGIALSFSVVALMLWLFVAMFC